MPRCAPIGQAIGAADLSANREPASPARPPARRYRSGESSRSITQVPAKPVYLVPREDLTSSSRPPVQHLPSCRARECRSPPLPRALSSQTSSPSPSDRCKRTQAHFSAWRISAPERNEWSGSRSRARARERENSRRYRAKRCHRRRLQECRESRFSFAFLILVPACQACDEPQQRKPGTKWPRARVGPARTRRGAAGKKKKKKRYVPRGRAVFPPFVGLADATRGELLPIRRFYASERELQLGLEEPATFHPRGSRYSRRHASRTFRTAPVLAAETNVGFVVDINLHKNSRQTRAPSRARVRGRFLAKCHTLVPFNLE